MFICAEHLHIPHCEFMKLPFSERIKWMIWVEEEAKYRNKEYKRMDDERRYKELEAKAKKAEKPGAVRVDDVK